MANKNVQLPSVRFDTLAHGTPNFFHTIIHLVLYLDRPCLFSFCISHAWDYLQNSGLDRLGTTRILDIVRGMKGSTRGLRYQSMERKR